MLLHVKNLKKNIANIIPQTRVKLHELKEKKYCIGIVEAKVGIEIKIEFKDSFEKNGFNMSLTCLQMPISILTNSLNYENYANKL
jgi:hypothetical protein